ncbi:MAG TPA: extracellular solute-binding protein, partial [Candidatus Atribacteria bacterium]|nr:extracellular solute-binding protein [Candidatus Atribacteria bacterium]
GDRPNMEPGSSDLTDAILERNRKIEERFNCKIVYDYYDPVSFYDTVYPILMSGEKFADVITPTLFNYGKFVNGDYLYDLNKLPYIKLDEPYWYDIYDEAAVTTDGRRLGASCFIANPFRRVFGVFFNKRLIEELKLDNPYDLLARGEWNWENFSRLLGSAMKDVNNDAVYDDNDVFSITGGLDGGIQALYLTSGNKMFEIGENGYVRYAMTNPNVMNVLTQLKDMFAVPGSYYSGSWDASRCTQQFVDGRVTFYLNLAAKCPHLRDMEDDYGLVPLPLGPGQTDFISAIDHNTAIICVPYTIDNPEATGAILQALAAASAKEREIWEAELEALNFRDDESYKNMKEYILPSITFDPLFMYHKLAPEFFKYTTRTVFEPVVRDRALDAASMINEGKEVVQTLIDEIINKVSSGD